MKLDVLTYQNVPNPEGVQPNDWPADVIEVADNATPRPNATLMTTAQYAAYRATRQATYDAWYNGTFKPATLAAFQAAKDAAEPFLASLRDNYLTAISGNTTFLALTGATNAQTLNQVQALTNQMNMVLRMNARVVVRLM